MEKPILFSRIMVDAILVGRKVQTRRIVNFHQKTKWHIGDNLWIKETFEIIDFKNTELMFVLTVKYKNGDKRKCCLTDAEAIKYSKWKNKIGRKSSLFMFKSLSRIQLKITDVIVERLWEITEDDAIKEGTDKGSFLGSFKEGFILLWEKINGINSWTDNPFVYKVTFEIL